MKTTTLPVEPHFLPCSVNGEIPVARWWDKLLEVDAAITFCQVIRLQEVG